MPRSGIRFEMERWVGALCQLVAAIHGTLKSRDRKSPRVSRPRMRSSPPAGLSDSAVGALAEMRVLSYEPGCRETDEEPRLGPTGPTQ